jgi:transporter family-2 protein
MKIGLILFVALAGILNTLQSGSNATLNKTLERPVWAIVCVFAVALATALLFALVSGQRLPSREQMALVPWWAWPGGVLGAVYILSMMLAADKLGAAVFMSLTVTMAVITSLIMDHFGLMGFQRHTAGWGRIAGGALMAAGLALIAKF